MNLPPYPTFPTVSSNSVLLRQLAPVDIDQIVGISFYDGKQAETLEQATQMLEQIDLDYTFSCSIHWGIEDVDSNKLVGTCGYYRGFSKSTGELGCILLPQFRGKGFMTEAMKLAINFGFNVMKLNIIMAITSTQNPDAIRLLERLRFHEADKLHDGHVKYELHTTSPEGA